MMSTGDASQGRHTTAETEAKAQWNWMEHLPLLVTVFSALAIGIRIIIVAGHNLENVYAILQASGTGSVIAGTLIPAIGFLMPSLALIIIMILREDSIAGSLKPFAVGVTIFLSLTSIVITPFLMFVLIAAWVAIWYSAVGLATVFRRGETFSRRGGFAARIAQARGKLSSRNLFTTVVAIWAGYNFFVVVTNTVPWVPAERIAPVKEQPFTGYVFGETDTDVSILSADNHQMVHMDPNQIVSRTVCQPAGVLYGGIELESLTQLVFGQKNPSYPKCPQ